MATKQEQEALALQCAKYLDNMRRLKTGSKHPDVPTDHLTDYFSEDGELPHIEDDISVRDVVFGPNYSEGDSDCDETILIERGDDGYFGYTKSHTTEVIALALTYRFLDMKLPYKETIRTKHSDHCGLYASDIVYIMDDHKHLEDILKGCTKIEYDYERDIETSFYAVKFCGEDLIIFNDDMDYCTTDEEYICELFLTDLESKFKSFTIFSTPNDVFSLDKVTANVY